MVFREEYPCSNPTIPPQDRAAIREAGRLGLIFANVSGDVTAEGRRRAGDMASSLASGDPDGPYSRAAEMLYLGSAVALQCVKNNAIYACPFRCPNKVADKN